MQSLNQNEKDVLGHFEHLKSLDDLEIDQVANALNRISIQAESIVYAKGDPDDCAYVVISGGCRLVTGHSAGGCRVVLRGYWRGR